MANYPPPPPGGGYGPSSTYDPYAADRAVHDWAKQKGFKISSRPELPWYQAWYPFQFMFPLAGVIRELRAKFGDARAYVVEGLEGNSFKSATGDDRHLYAFITSPKLTYRSAIRSKSGGSGIIEDVSQGLDSLFGANSPQTGAILGDPTFESRYEVLAPNRDEGVLALTMPLRQLLMTQGFSGILELRQGGLALISYSVRTFQVPQLDVFMGFVEQLITTASQTSAVVTPPPTA